MSADSSFLRSDNEYDREGEAGGSYRNRVLAELRSLVSDAERLLRQAADSSAETLSGMRAHFDRRIERTRYRLDRTRQRLSEGARVQTEAVRGHVRENPLRSVGIATVAGVVFGLLVVSLLNSRRD